MPQLSPAEPRQGPRAGYGRQDRATQNRPDRLIGSMVRTIYFVPSDAVDRGSDTDGTIVNGLGGIQQWFAQQAGGRGYRWRLDTVDGDAADVVFVRGELPQADYAGRSDLIADELIDRRYWLPESKFVVFEDGDGLSGNCGTAHQPLPVVGNRFADDPERAAKIHDFAFVHLGACDLRRGWGSPGSPGFPEAVAMHELVHSLGLVALGAPHYCSGNFTLAHVCTGANLLFTNLIVLDPESRDVMYPAIVYPLSELTLDRDNDDYFLATNVLGAPDLSSSPFVEIR